MLELEGGDHLPDSRDPVQVNLAIREFVDPSFARDPTRPSRPTAAPGPLRHSPIGLGHARRDIAIARELRNLVADLEIDWLAQDPVTRVLEEEGERIHPASAQLANESRHLESE